MIGAISKAQVPDSHPAMQMRKYYADVYTRNSIMSYESESIDSVLVIASMFMEVAQVISLYSYKQDPYHVRQSFNVTSGYPDGYKGYFNIPCLMASLPVLPKKSCRPLYHYRQSR